MKHTFNVVISTYDNAPIPALWRADDSLFTKVSEKEYKDGSLVTNGGHFYAFPLHSTKNKLHTTPFPLLIKNYGRRFSQNLW
jgi:hypothetical protein